MRSLFKFLLYILVFAGYIFNMYFLTVDPEIRNYQWVNKVGIIIVPLGSITGYVYVIDKKGLLK